MAGSVSILGLGSGLELQSILDQLKDVEKVPITIKENQKLLVQDQIAEFDVLQAKMLALKDGALNMSLQSTYIKRSSDLSNSSPMTVSVNDGVDPATYNLNVKTLAQKSSWKTATGLASSGAYVNETGRDMTFTYTANGNTAEINVSTGTTLGQLAAAINDDPNNAGVTASVVQEGTGSDAFKLLIQSNTLGEEGRVTDVSFSQAEEWRTAATFKTGALTAQDADTDWPTMPEVSGTWTGSTAGTYTFTESSGTAKTVGTDEITLNYTDPVAGSGTVIIPADYVSGDTITGPDGIELSFNVGDVLAGAEEFEVLVENDAINAAEEIFTYSYGGVDRNLTVAAGSDLQDLVDLINNDPNNVSGSKVTASLVEGGTAGEYSLKIVPDDVSADIEVTGTWAGLEMTEAASPMSFSEETGAAGALLDASVQVDGVTYTRGSNSISDVVEGVTLNLLTTGETSLTIKQDTSETSDLVKTFVTDLQDLLTEIDTHDDINPETNVGNALYGVTSISSYKTQFMSEIFNPVDIDGSSVTTLVDLGVEVDRDGNISIDEDVLADKLTNNFEDVKNFLIGDTENNITGWGDSINTKLRMATSSADGIIKTEKDAAQRKYDRYETQITDAEARLDRRYEIMAKQFSALDSYMSRMTSQSNYLTQTFDALANAQSSD